MFTACPTISLSKFPFNLLKMLIGPDIKVSFERSY